MAFTEKELTKWYEDFQKTTITTKALLTARVMLTDYLLKEKNPQNYPHWAIALKCLNSALIQMEIQDEFKKGKL